MANLKQIEQAYLDCGNAEYDIFTRNPKKMEIRGAQIIWKNFEGRMNDFGSAKRQFTIVIPEEVAAILQQRGWNVKSKLLERFDVNGQPAEPAVVTADGQVPTAYYITINVSMDGDFPPIITRISQINNQTVEEVMNLATVKDLDRDTFLDASVIINEYVSERGKTRKVSGYLNKMTVVTDPESREADFGGRYEHYFGDNANQ